MAQKKFDGVVEAVRYASDGKVNLVRVYERRGPAFSDRILLTRQEFVDRLKAKKRFFVGRRTPYLAGTFELGAPVHLSGSSGQEILSAGDHAVDSSDRLEGVPLF